MIPSARSHVRALQLHNTWGWYEVLKSFCPRTLDEAKVALGESIFDLPEFLEAWEEYLLAQSRTGWGLVPSRPRESRPRPSPPRTEEHLIPLSPEPKTVGGRVQSHLFQAPPGKKPRKGKSSPGPVELPV